MTTHRIVVLVALFAFLAYGGIAYAQDFVPIVPLPDLPIDGSATLPDYLNRVFQLSIMLGGILAVVFLIIGGFEYMTSEATGKKDGKERIQNALLGLALLLFSYLILYIINPNILKLDVLGAPTAAPITQQTGVTPTTQPTQLCPSGACNGTTFQFVNEVTPQAVDAFRQTCSTSNGTLNSWCLDGDLGMRAPGRTGSCASGFSMAQVCVPTNR